MADTMQSVDVKDGGRKRKSGKNKGKMEKKRQRVMMAKGSGKKVRVDKKMRKLIKRRVRDYNSDNSDEEKQEDEPVRIYERAIQDKKEFKKKEDDIAGGLSDDGEEDNQGFDPEDVSEDENGGAQPGVMKLTEGIKGFKLAFTKVVSSGIGEDILGPVLSANKKLIAEKLAEEEAEKKVKGEVKKEKLREAEQGHIKLESILDAHEKFLLGVATKGVVKLFNAVNKAQNAQKGLNPSRLKDEKVIKKRRKEAFFSELGKTPSSQSVGTTIKVGGEAPAWAPLRDNYMLTNPKLKDWDKMQDTNTANDFGKQSDSDSSSDDD
ncbi:hypothetical protein CASFOL_011332 [Castilleja foliolosa]|uniref:RRP15-like protein n=1 Tax=Castilleja foliolosa TaxID=1961234 RepID=A0ABD3DVS8_9LAMI